MANIRNKKKKSTLDSQNLVLKDIKPKTANQSKFFENYDSGLSQVLLGYPGTGKAQPLYSSILTPNGWVMMEDIKVDDVVRSIDDWTAVTGVFPQGQKEVVRLHFKDGGYTDCCEEHLWTVHSNINSKGNKGPTKKVTINTREIMELLDSKTKKLSADYANISVDCVKAIDMKEKEFIISPYVLGALLGDGGLTTSSVTLTSIDQEIVDKVRAELPEGISLTNRKDPISFGFVDNAATWKVPNKITAELKSLGLLGKKSEFKYIPTTYLEGSIGQRYSLLQGLMDTDGTVDKRTGATTYATSSKSLGEDVRTLVLSLGGKASISEKEPYYTNAVGEKKKGLTSYIISILLEDKTKCFSLPRKSKYTSTTDKNQLRRVVSHYEVLGYTEMQCISVAHESKLYVTDDFLLTHNTFLAMYKAFEEINEASSVFNKIIIARSAVPTRDQGHLPGTLEDKNAVYELPYRAICNELFGRGDAYELLKKSGMLEFTSTGFMRGITLDRTIIIGDEIQNYTASEADTLLTRGSNYSKTIFCGDILQRDLTRYSEKDIEKFLKVILDMPEDFNVVQFGLWDIVRGGLCGNYIRKKFSVFPDGF